MIAARRGFVVPSLRCALLAAHSLAFADPNFSWGAASARSPRTAVASQPMHPSEFSNGPTAVIVPRPTDARRVSWTDLGAVVDAQSRVVDGSKVSLGAMCASWEIHHNAAPTLPRRRARKPGAWVPHGGAFVSCCFWDSDRFLLDAMPWSIGEALRRSRSALGGRS